MNFFNKILALIVLFIGAFTFAISGNLEVRAETLADINILKVKCIFPPSTTTTSGCTADTSLFGIILNFLTTMAPFLAVLAIVYGGYLYYMGAFNGDSKRGLEAIRSAVIGLVIVLLVPIIKGIFDTVTTKTTDTLDGKMIATTIASKLIVPILNILIYASGAFAVLALVYGGYRYITAGISGKSGAEEGKNAIKNGIIGLLVTLLAVSIVGLIQNFTGGLQ